MDSLRGIRIISVYDCVTAQVVFGQGSQGFFSLARILVADDDASYRRVVKVALSLRGHEVREASNGFEALDLMKTHPADLVLLDWQMPGMGGEETARKVREFSDAPIVVVSSAERSAEAAALGLQGALRKPVDFTALHRVIDSVLPRRS